MPTRTIGKFCNGLHCLPLPHFIRLLGLPTPDSAFIQPHNLLYCEIALIFPKAIGAIIVNNTCSTLAGSMLKAYTTAERTMHNANQRSVHISVDIMSKISGAKFLQMYSNQKYANTKSRENFPLYGSFAFLFLGSQCIVLCICL